MRTTIRLDDGLLRRAKAHAAASGRSLNDFISDAVRAALAPVRARAGGVELPTFPGGTLLPGIDLDDTSALLDVMDTSREFAEGTPSPAKVAETRRSRPRGRS